MTNIEKLTARLNACKNRRKIYNFLMAMANTPSVQQAEAPADKLNAILDALKGEKQA